MHQKCNSTRTFLRTTSVMLPLLVPKSPINHHALQSRNIQTQ